MLKSSFAGLLLIAVLLAPRGMEARAFISPPEQAYRVIGPPEYPNRDLWQTDAPYLDDLKTN